MTYNYTCVQLKKRDSANSLMQLLKKKKKKVLLFHSSAIDSL